MDSSRIAKLNEILAGYAKLVNSVKELPADLEARLARLIDAYPGSDVPAELMFLVKAQPVYVSPIENYSNKINELVAELTGLDNVEPDFDIHARNIEKKINENVAELVSLATHSDESTSGIVKETIHDRDAVAKAAAEANRELAANILGDSLRLFPDARSANKAIASEKTGPHAEAMVAQAIQEHVTEIISLKKSETDSVSASDADIGVLVYAIGATVTHFIENNKIELEVQSIKRMTDAELVSFIESVKSVISHLNL